MPRSLSLVACVAVIACLGVLVLIGLDRTESTRESTFARALLLEGARSEGNLISAINDEALAHGSMSDTLVVDLEGASQRLRAGAGSFPAESGLGAAVEAYLVAVEQDLSLILGGESEAAHNLDQTLVDPAFDTMMDLLSDHIVEAQEATARARRAGRIVMHTIVVLAVAVTSTLLWFMDRSNRRARRILEADGKRKTEFVALASHELRTPLTSIVGFSELLVASENLSPAERDYAAYVHSEGERLSRITSDLLSVARIESGESSFELEDLDFAEVIDTVVRAQCSAAHPITVLMDGVPIVRGHREKLIEVVGNLVENAVKYSPGGGRISIRWEFVDRRRIRVSVTDEGLGIPEAEVSKLFTRFHYIERPEHRNIRSTGLGLYVVKELVARMGGDVGVRSTPGHGSTFWFTLATRQVAAEAA